MLDLRWALSVFLIAGLPANATNSKPSNRSSSKSPNSIASKLDYAKELVIGGNKLDALEQLSKNYASSGLDANAKTQSRNEYLKTWEEIANLFVTDKAQNNFSLAESIWMTRPKEAIAFLQTASQQEPGNLQVSLLGARAALRLQECARAETFSKEAEKIFWPGAEVRLVALQVRLCFLRGQTQAPPLNIKLMTEAGESWGELDSAVRALIVGDLWRRSDFEGASAAITAWESQATGDPEVWYWKWKVSDSVAGRRESEKAIEAGGKQAKMKDASAARNYLRLCNELSPRKRKSLSMHPELCLWTETVESDLKSREKQGI
jgi:hypothetical protein